MTYAQFIARFLLPLVVLSAVPLIINIRSAINCNRFVLTRFTAAMATILPLAALVYTTPWDGWLIEKQVLWYAKGSALGTVFHVPFEEYMFMVGTTVATECWALALAGVHRGPLPFGRRAALTERARNARCRIRATAGWLAAAATGAMVVGYDDHLLYLGSQVAWFGIPLALQSACAADLLRDTRRFRLAGLSVTPLLWVADGIAIHSGTWLISARYILGLRVGPLPLEEATFFLLVNLLVVNSVALHLHPQIARRLGRWSAAQAPIAAGEGRWGRAGSGCQPRQAPLAYTGLRTRPAAALMKPEKPWKHE